MIDVDQILELQKRNIAEWHTAVETKEEVLPWKFIEENNLWNFKVWHEEDIARLTDVEPMRIVQVKRNIDVYNQARNNAMEKIDEWVLNYLASHHVSLASKMHSETPGMMIDRLSIMALKRYHMLEETQRQDAAEEHKLNCSKRLAVLDEQISDLSLCLAEVFEQLQNGTLKFRVYRQFKMYNDPSLNPQLYNRSKTDD